MSISLCNPCVEETFFGVFTAYFTVGVRAFFAKFE
jgi:hypothetical protein